MFLLLSSSWTLITATRWEGYVRGDGPLTCFFTLTPYLHENVAPHFHLVSSQGRTISSRISLKTPCRAQWMSRSPLSDFLFVFVAATSPCKSLPFLRWLSLQEGSGLYKTSGTHFLFTCLG